MPSESGRPHDPSPRGWLPPAGPDIELVPSGVWWDAVKLPALLGDQLLARLGDRGGSVIRDSWGQMFYWLIPQGAADSWVRCGLTGVQVLGPACYVAVPPPHRVRSPGVSWATPPDADRIVTDPGTLHQSLCELLDVPPHADHVVRPDVFRAGEEA